jgi:hypothetical protein
LKKRLAILTRLISDTGNDNLIDLHAVSFVIVDYLTLIG